MYNYVAIDLFSFLFLLWILFFFFLDFRYMGLRNFYIINLKINYYLTISLLILYPYIFFLFMFFFFVILQHWHSTYGIIVYVGLVTPSLRKSIYFFLSWPPGNKCSDLPPGKIYEGVQDFITYQLFFDKTKRWLKCRKNSSHPEILQGISQRLCWIFSWFYPPHLGFPLASSTGILRILFLEKANILLSIQDL